MLDAPREPGNDLGAAFDAMSAGMVLVDEKMRIRLANGAAAIFLQAKRDDLAGKDASEYILDPEVIEAVRAVSSGSVRRRSTLEVQKQGEAGTGVLRFSVRPVRHDDSAIAMIIIEDITQHRVAEEARNAFVTQATHELRGPLTNIRLYVERAIDDGQNDPTIRAECLNVVNREARRLEHIVGEMLSVAEIEAGTLKIGKDDVRLDAMLHAAGSRLPAPGG